MKVKTPETGGLCQSIQGRDKGRYYIIVSVSGESVFVADGNFKRLASPKKKNAKHSFEAFRRHARFRYRNLLCA